MTCIKTGCDAYLDQYGEFVHGDAFEVDGLLIIRCAGRRRDRSESGLIHVSVHSIEEWFDKDKTSMSHNSTLIARNGRWHNFGYEGVKP